MQCIQLDAKLMEGSTTCPESGLHHDLKPSLVLTGAKWWRWQRIPTELLL